jgi:hypothetical protein
MQRRQQQHASRDPPVEDVEAFIRHACKKTNQVGFSGE